MARRMMGSNVAEMTTTVSPAAAWARMAASASGRNKSAMRSS